MNPTFLLLETIHPEAHALLAAEGRVLHAEDPAEVERIVQTEPVDALVTRGRGQIRAPLIAQAEHLRVIARMGVGLDNIDVEAATERGVLVINAPGSTTVAVAEHTMLLMMALIRQFYPTVQATLAGDWAVRRRYTGNELTDQTLGIIGLGAIGLRVARLATAFGMHVRYWTRTPKNVPYDPLPLDELLQSSDIISLHMALTPETRHFIGPDELSAMKPGTLLINTARGALIDQQALVTSLNNGHLGGFAADVLDQEPPAADEPLLRCENVLLTPHTAALTRTSYRKMCLRTAKNLLAALNGTPFETRCLVNAEGLSVLNK